MTEPIADASIYLWGREVATVSWSADDGFALFRYTPEFADTGIELSPLVMPLSRDPYSFPALPRTTFKGLPGMLADALPDRFGDQLINAWLAEQARTPESFNPVERLCYLGAQGMGALEFRPALAVCDRKARSVEVVALVRMVNQLLNEKTGSESVNSMVRAAKHDLTHLTTFFGLAPRRAEPARRQSSPGIRRPESFVMARLTPGTALNTG